MLHQGLLRAEYLARTWQHSVVFAISETPDTGNAGETAELDAKHLVVRIS